MSQSSSISRSDAEALVRSSLEVANENWNRSEFANPPNDLNIFERLDSFSIVELLMQTEVDVEKVVGRYIPLANESILDVTVSPLRRLDSWIDYVAATVNHG